MENKRESKIREEFWKNRPQPVTPEELGRAKDWIKNHYAPGRPKRSGSFFRLLWVCARFGTVWGWGLKGVLLFFFYQLTKTGARQEFAGMARRHIAVLLAGFGLLLAMSAIPWLCRSVRYQMLDIECASYFSIGRLLLARMIFLGVGDGIFLAAMAGRMSVAGILKPGQSVFLGIFAFLAGACVLAWLAAKGMFSRMLPVYGGFCAVFLALANAFSPDGTALLLLPWQVQIPCCLAAFLLLCGQMRRIAGLTWCRPDEV